MAGMSTKTFPCLNLRRRDEDPPCDKDKQSYYTANSAAGTSHSSSNHSSYQAPMDTIPSSIDDICLSAQQVPQCVLLFSKNLARRKAFRYLEGNPAEWLDACRRSRTSSMPSLSGYRDTACYHSRPVESQPVVACPAPGRADRRWQALR